MVDAIILPRLVEVLELSCRPLGRRDIVLHVRLQSGVEGGIELTTGDRLAVCACVGEDGRHHGSRASLGGGQRTYGKHRTQPKPKHMHLRLHKLTAASCGCWGCAGARPSFASRSLHLPLTRKAHHEEPLVLRAPLRHRARGEALRDGQDESRH